MIYHSYINHISFKMIPFSRLGDIAEYDNGMIIIAGWDGEGTTEFMNTTSKNWSRLMRIMTLDLV